MIRFAKSHRRWLWLIPALDCEIHMRMMTRLRRGCLSWIEHRDDEALA